MLFPAWARRAHLSAHLPLVPLVLAALLFAPALVAADVTGPSAPVGADSPAAQQPQGILGSPFMLFIMIGGIVLFMFMTNRTQKAEEAKKKAMIESLKPGQKVVTTFGMVAEIDRIGAQGTTIWLLQGEGKSAIPVEYLRSAIANPYDPTPAATTDKNGKPK